MTSENPYASPQPIEEAVPVAQFGGSLPIASPWHRLIGFFIDLMIAMFAAIAFQVLLHQVMTVAPSTAVSPGEIIERQVTTVIVERQINRAIFGGVSFICIYVVLVGFMEFVSHRSPGKFAIGMRVVRTNGGVPTVSQIARRTLARFLIMEMFFYTARFPISWHDWLSDTRVIENRR